MSMLDIRACAVSVAAQCGYIDSVIEPQHPRPTLIRALVMVSTKRMTRPSRKHGNIPL